MRTRSPVNSVRPGGAGQAPVGNTAHGYLSASPDTMRITGAKYYLTKSAIKGGSAGRPGSKYC